MRAYRNLRFGYPFEFVDPVGAARKRIVVGVGRDSATAGALRWALRTALVSDALVVAVTAYASPVARCTMYGWVCVDAGAAEAAARAAQGRALRTVLGEGAHRPRLRRVVARGEPVSVLLAAAADADLLVVGRRSSRLHRLVSGSVSKGCALGAPCPVVVVHDGEAPVRVTDDLAAGAGGTRGAGADHGHRHPARRRAQFELRRSER